MEVVASDTSLGQNQPGLRKDKIQTAIINIGLTNKLSLPLKSDRSNCSEMNMVQQGRVKTLKLISMMSFIECYR